MGHSLLHPGNTFRTGKGTEKLMSVPSVPPWWVPSLQKQKPHPQTGLAVKSCLDLDDLGENDNQREQHQRLDKRETKDSVSWKWSESNRELAEVGRGTLVQDG